MNILILGGRAPVAVHLARVLSMHNVFVADSLMVTLSKKSHFVKETFKINSKPNKDIKGYLNELNTIINKNNIELLIPTCEEAIYISLIKSNLDCTVFMDDFDKIILLHNKYDFINLCKRIGLKTPKTQLINCNTKVEIKEKSVLKPVFSRFGTYVKVINSTSDININDKKDYVLQEFIKGTQYCTYSIVKNGEILLHVNYKTKHSLGMGTSIYYEDFPCDKLKDMVSKIVKSLNFSGQIAFDFIASDGEFYPIECNPRSTSGLTLIPYNTDIIKAYMEGKPIEVNEFLTTSMKTNMFLLGIFKGSFLKKDFKKDYKKSRDIVYDKKDKRPFFNQLPVVIYFFILSLIHRKSLTGITTFDIEYDGDGMYLW